MNRKLTPYIYILFFASSFQGITAQDFTLKLVGKDSIETTILNQLSFTASHKDEKSVYEELKTIQNQIQKLGYFTSIFKGISKTNTEIKAEFSLGTQTESVVILITEQTRRKYPNLFFTNRDSVFLKAKEVENYIELIIQEFDNAGKSFEEVKLINPKFSPKALYLEISIEESTKRMINKVVVKGYDNFPKPFITKYFKINAKRIFSKNELNRISKQTRSLDFVKEIKPPEVLFKQDSTIVYLFLERAKKSSIDGILNFASKDDGSGLLINGNLDLRLKNILNSGERFHLFWNRVKEENSEFRLSTEIPYIFNSSFSPELNFSIYRQDSTFLTTNFQIGLGYQINEKSKVSLSYSSERSDYLLDQIQTDFETYTKTFWYAAYSYLAPTNNPQYSRAFYGKLTLGHGQRESLEDQNDQAKILLDSETNISISKRAYLNLKNKTGFLSSKRFLTNELFRIGGANSIRGFNEQSIFTDQFSYVNIEYRYLTSVSSYLHTITDFGLYKNRVENSNESIMGLGLGYLFSIENNLINLGYALGVTPGENFNFNQSKLIVRFISSF